MQTITDISTPRAAAPSAAARPLRQLSVTQTLGVWAAAAVPMALLSWVAAPLIADRLDGPGALARALIATLTAGLVWQGALVLILVAREQGTLRWAVLREALWLRAPVSPVTGRRGGRLWLVVPLLMVLFFAEAMIPDAGAPASRDLAVFLDSSAGEQVLTGAWGWFAVVVVLALFNTVLGEELLFRGYLLPRMEGAFGRGDWMANGVLFAVYHLHMPWAIPAILLDTFILAYPSRRYRSAVIGILVHSAQSVVVVGATLAVVLGG